MASTVTGLMMRRMGTKSGSSIDWETIAKGMLDYTTEFSLENIPYNPSKSYFLQGRTNLKGVLNIPTGTTAVGTNAFYETGITSAIIPDSVPSIEYMTFGRCASLTYVDVKGDTQIKGNAFNNCWALTTFIMRATVPPTLAAGGIPSSGNLKIYVPDASVEDYKAATVWSNYASKIYPISQLPT